jgi:hypothetical protein
MIDASEVAKKRRKTACLFIPYKIGVCNAVQCLIDSVAAKARVQDVFSRETGIWRPIIDWFPEASFISRAGIN